MPSSNKGKNIVSVIIVNWNGIDHLIKCLPSLYKQKYKNLEVILVDNASSDGSIEYVKEHFPKTKIIINKKNLGFAEGNNVGFTEASGDYVLFLNNDTKVSYNFLSEMVKALEKDGGIGGVQSKILLMDQPTRLDSVGAYLTNTGFLYHFGVYKEDSKKYNKQIEIYSAKGACMLFRREVLEKVKVENEIFDSSYFAYFEETDLCHRVWLAGYKIIFLPSSVIYHKMGATSKNFSNPFIQYHSYKNRINSYIKNLGLFWLLTILPIHLLFCEIAATIYLLQQRFGVFLAIQRAIIWNITHINSTLKKRTIIQDRIRKLEDNSISKYITKTVGFKYYFYLFRGLEYYSDEI